MYCLHCGDCCKRMRPISAPDPCPYLIERELDGQQYVLCSIYDNRPEECRNHSFPARVCPIGASLLDLPTTDALRKRIDDGFTLTEALKRVEGRDEVHTWAVGSSAKRYSADA